MGKRICAYCSSSDILEDKYKEVAECFAKAASLLRENTDAKEIKIVDSVEGLIPSKHYAPA
ncbi:MAG: hypothetical protein ABFC28_01210 [Rikenellaceae bacterium]